MSVVTKPICSCQDKNMNSHVHLNSYVTNNKFPKNNIKILCLIKFFLQNPTTSMRNWVCPHNLNVELDVTVTDSLNKEVVIII